MNVWLGIYWLIFWWLLQAFWFPSAMPNSVEGTAAYEQWVCWLLCSVFGAILLPYNFRIHGGRRINWLEDPGLIFLCACAHLHMCGYTCICVCRPEDGLRYLFLSVSTLFCETVSYWPARLDRQTGVAQDPRLSLPSSRTAVCAAVIGFPTLKNSVFLGSSLEPPPCKASTLLIELCPQPGLGLWPDTLAAQVPLPHTQNEMCVA